HQYDDDVQDAVRADFAVAFGRRPRDEWVVELAGADTCVAPVQAVAEIASDPQYAWRGAVVEAKHPGRGTFRQVGPVLAGTGEVPEPVCVPEEGATDTDELLAEAGIPAAHVAALRARKVVA
ncbi:MAG: CoA transferase, partial [Streptosporangiaceae bacterium]